MVYFVLDDLGGPAGEGFDAGLKIDGLPADLDGLIPLAGTGTAKQGETSFLRIVRSGFFKDLRVEHGHVGALVIEHDDALVHADHIGGHADAALFVGGEGIEKIPGGLQVFF